MRRGGGDDLRGERGLGRGMYMGGTTGEYRLGWDDTHMQGSGDRL